MVVFRARAAFSSTVIGRMITAPSSYIVPRPVRPDGVGVGADPLSEGPVRRPSRLVWIHRVTQYAADTTILFHVNLQFLISPEI